MTQTVEIARISASTLTELRKRAKNGHLDSLIHDAIVAYDEVNRTSESSPIAPAENASHLDDPHDGVDSRPAPETVESRTEPQSGTDLGSNGQKSIPGPTAQLLLEGPKPNSRSMDQSMRRVINPKPSVFTIPIINLNPETEKPAGSGIDPDRTPPSLEHPEQEDQRRQDGIGHKPQAMTPDFTEGDSTGHPEAPEGMSQTLVTESRMAEPSVNADDELAADVELPEKVTNTDLSFTILTYGVIDGEKVTPTAWFSMLGFVAIRMGTILNKSGNDLVRFINRSDLGIRATPGIVRERGFHPVPGAGFSIRKVAAGKTWMAIVRMAKKCEMTVDVYLIWQPEKPSLHPGKVGHLHVSRKA